MGNRHRISIGLPLLAAMILCFVVGCPSSDPKPETKRSDKQPEVTPGKATTAVLESSKTDAGAPGDTLATLLETLPKETQPHDDKDASRLAAAGKWLTANLTGKRASITSSLERILITPPSKAGEKYRLTLTNGSSRSERRFYIVRGFGNGTKISNGLDLWDGHWMVELRKLDEASKSATSGINLTVEKSELDRLRALEMQPGGPDTRLTFTIADISVEGKRVIISVKDLVVDKSEA